MDAFGPRTQRQELIFSYSMKDTEDLAGPQRHKGCKMDAFGPRTQRQELIFSSSMKDTDDLAGLQNAQRLKNLRMGTSLGSAVGSPLRAGKIRNVHTEPVIENRSENEKRHF